MATIATQARPRFYVWVGIAAVAIAFAGFLPTYWMPLFTGRTFPPIVHIHGVVFIAWNMLYLWQSWLVATGRTADHRQWGLVGIAIATAMAITVLLLVLTGYHSAAAIGMEREARIFSSVPLTGMAYFVVFFTLAVRNVRSPDLHRRYMFGAAVPLLQAPIARWFQVALAPPGAVGPPPVEVVIAPTIVVVLAFYIPLYLHDKRSIGRLHPASAAVIAVSTFMMLLPVVLGPTSFWISITDVIAALVPKG